MSDSTIVLEYLRWHASRTGVEASDAGVLSGREEALDLLMDGTSIRVEALCGDRVLAHIMLRGVDVTSGNFVLRTEEDARLRATEEKLQGIAKRVLDALKGRESNEVP